MNSKHGRECRILADCKQLEALILFVDESKKLLSSINDAALKDFLVTPLENDFSGKLKESLLIYVPGHPITKRILLTGLGKKDDITLKKMRTAAAAASGELSRRKVYKNVGALLPKIGKLATKDIAEAIKLGADIFQYKTEELKTDSGKKRKDTPIVEITPILSDKSDKKDAKSVIQGFERGETIAAGVNFARRLINLSPLQITPELLAGEAKKMVQSSAVKSKIKIDVWNKEKLTKHKFGGVLGVGRGSVEDPRLIILEYNGGKKGESPVVLVGKGITFDSGGLSLKPPSSQETMKYDMAGAASVLGAFKIVTDLGLKKNLVVIVPSAENMPSGHAQRPGDVITMANGKTVEVLNTDAEGRLILADALYWATTQYKPKACIDVATLTGACALAVGNAAAGLFGNNPKLNDSLMKVADQVQEGLWPLPDFDDFYADLLHSEVADLRNISKIREAGATTAALFLENFVHNNTPWAHLDIAGCGWYDSPRDFIGGRGASGVPVRLLAQFVENNG